MPTESWAGLGWQAWVTLGVIAVVFALLALTQIATDVVLVGGVTILLVTGVLSAQDAFAGMHNEGMLTVAVLYVVVAGLEATGGTAWLVQRVLGRPRSLFGAVVKMMAPVSFMSAFLNNTPVVAMFLPAVKDWARQHRLSVSKLMIPLSYAAVLGGVCTLIGSSTNLVVNGLLIAAKQPSMHMFDLAWVGVPCAVAGMLFILLLGRRLLPDRRPAISESDDPREYTVEMLVDPGSPLVGKTVEEAGLRHLPGMFLAEIDRQGEILPAVPPQEVLQADDRLVFVGIVESVVDLQKFRGLKPATDQVFKLDAPRAERCLVEAVVSTRCPLVGQTIRDGRFRTVYNAVVIAVGRAGERIHKKIGDIVLQPGDTLLLEAHPTFVEQQRNSRHFFLVSQVQNSSPPRHERAWMAIAIMVAMVLAVTFEWLSMLKAGMLAAGAMILTRCCTGQIARRSVDWQIVIAIAASFAIGRALETTGVANVVAQGLIGMAGGSPWPTLVVVYGVTLLLTELITNNAAAVLVFPIALQTAQKLGVDFMPLAMAVTVAASCGFATPLGYQTHMMVYGPGGYRFTDFLRVGVPLDLLCWVVATTLIPWVFPFNAI
ncbi:MAG: SLC13 family permease [Planctomycetota bacterium]